MDNKIKLDIGSGRKSFEDYITLDKEPKVGADICMDIENDYIDNIKHLKLATVFGDVDEIRAHHILEHFKPENKVLVMQRFYDLLKFGGILDIEVPKFPHPASVQDPTHISFWCKESFWYFIKGNKFGEAFVQRCPGSPLFEFIDEEDESDWKYRIRLKKV